MPILLLVHVEESFRKHFPDMYVQRLIRGCKSNKYNKVIHATSNICDDNPIPEIADLVDEQIDWGWGYEPESFLTKEHKWVIPANGHEWTWVPPELRRLNRNTKVYLGGGYSSECLADMEVVLNFLDIRYKLIYGYVYP